MMDHSHDLFLIIICVITFSQTEKISKFSDWIYCNSQHGQNDQNITVKFINITVKLVNITVKGRLSPSTKNTINRIFQNLYVSFFWAKPRGN